MEGVSFVVANVNTPERHKVGFQEVYAEVFKEPPYGEDYKPWQVEEWVWAPHLEHGVIILALHEDRVIGFGCAIHLRQADSEVTSFVAEKNEEDLLVDATWYMSEVGVLKPYRKHGIGTQLIHRRILHVTEAGDSMYLMRTAVEGSHSIKLYESFGPRFLGIQDISKGKQVQINKSQSDLRIYLFGDCSKALDRLAKKKAAGIRAA